MNSIFISQQQKFTGNNEYVNEYFRLLTQYYSHWNSPIIHCTYYSLDLENSVIDETKLVNGAYETIGNLSGLRWRKILDFPLNGVEPLNTTPTTDEKGVTNSEKITSCWFPASIQIECHVHDFIMFTDTYNSDNYYLRNPPLFEVVNVERSPDFDIGFYKIMCKITYIPKTEIDKQIDGLFQYVQYENKMYGIDNAIILNKLLQERDKCICNSFYDQQTGLYFDRINLSDIAKEYFENQEDAVDNG